MSKNISEHTMAEAHTSLFIEKSRFRRNLWTMSLFGLPIAYLGIILAVFIHEVAGHGLTALLLGGQFKGFGISLDGMGWADIGIDGFSTLSKALMFAAGGVCTTLLSVLFFGLSLAAGRNYPTALACLFLGVAGLLDGLPYFFWDAIYLGGMGDFSMIWLLYHDRALRVMVIAGCGALMAAGIILFNVRYYKIACAWLGEGPPIHLKERISLALLIFLLQVLAWLGFDWNQLIPGVGLLPGLVAMAIALAALIPVTAFHRIEGLEEPGPGRLQVGGLMWAAWILCMLVIVLILQWLERGVAFS